MKSFLYIYEKTNKNDENLTLITIEINDFIRKTLSM